MRLDAREKPADPRCLYASVFLDGEKVERAAVADEEQGYVEVYLFGERDAESDTIRLERRCGQVKIAFSDDMPEEYARN